MMLFKIILTIKINQVMNKIHLLNQQSNLDSESPSIEDSNKILLRFGVIKRNADSKTF
jgi:hypothetical protein